MFLSTSYAIDNTYGPDHFTINRNIVQVQQTFLLHRATYYGIQLW